MPMSDFIPETFEIPRELVTTRLKLRPLTIHDLDADYEAVMSSIEHLRRRMPFGPSHDWPTQELTRDQNLIDLGWHQKEFQNRSTFTYTVKSTDERTCLGCLYIYPSMKQGHDAQIMMWVRASEAMTDLDEHLFETVMEWIRNHWPFKSPGYPGRTISWPQWDALPIKAGETVA